MYIDNATNNDTTETLSRDDSPFYNTTCQCHLTICDKLNTDELIRVVCVDYINDISLVRSKLCIEHDHLHTIKISLAI